MRAKKPVALRYDDVNWYFTRANLDVADIGVLFTGMFGVWRIAYTSNS